MEINKIKEILELHLLWLNGKINGVKADLSGAILLRADFSRADLSGGKII